MKAQSIVAATIMGLSVVLPGLTAFAQDTTCPELVQDSYDLTQEVCDPIGDDEACYGNLSIEAEPDIIEFDKSGDIVDVAEIESLRLSSMDTQAKEWGISLMHIQALATEDATPQAVELVLFGNVEIENTAEADSDFSPMQAFTFTSGVADRPCDVAPDSGILIQTPEGVGEITLFVNEVLIKIGSTVYLQAEPGIEMAISVVEGGATVTAFGTTVDAQAGSRARVPLDDNGLADGQPEGPEPYDGAELQTLPVVLLEEQIAIAPPSELDSNGESAPISGDEPALVSGEWQWTVTDNTCDPNVIGDTFNSAINFEFDDEDLIWSTEAEEPAVYSPVEPGVYVSEQQDATVHMEVVAADQISLVISWHDDCQDAVDLTLVSSTE